MVKNTSGGNKTKRGARKDFAETDNKHLRTIDDDEPCEMYGFVSKYFGNRMCEVTCHDGVNRLCIIRAKFSGKGKSSNQISVGKFVIVGIRDWEVRSDGEKKCDLLEVYNDADKERLFQGNDQKIVNLKMVLKNISGNADIKAAVDDDVVFSTTKFDYDEIITKKEKDTTESKVVLVHNSKIDFDDI